MLADYYHASIGNPDDAPFPREGASCEDCKKHIRTQAAWDDHTCGAEDED